jgi:WD40 repeat protein
VVSAITFDPSGRYIGVGAVDGMVQLWAATGDFEKLADLVGHSDMVHAVAFTPDGSLLATAGADETVRVWSVQERRPLHVLRGHLGGVRDMAFCEGGLLATSGSDGVMLLWDTTTGRRLSTLMPLPEQGYAIVLPDGRYSIRGDSERTFWWASKFCRFDERELRDRPEAGVVRVSGALPPRS